MERYDIQMPCKQVSNNEKTFILTFNSHETINKHERISCKHDNEFSRYDNNKQSGVGKWNREKDTTAGWLT